MMLESGEGGVLRAFWSLFGGVRCQAGVTFDVTTKKAVYITSLHYTVFRLSSYHTDS